MNLTNYIKVYKNVVSDSFCDKMIQKFEDNPKQFRFQQRENPTRNFKMSFNQIHIMEELGWEKETEFLLELFPNYVDKYREECNIIESQWPIDWGYESIRMKRYQPNGDEFFSPHVDVTNYANARRFLVFFLYLDNNSAGQTSFPQLDIGSNCVKGSLLMFPPMWPWLHAGELPIDKPKYIIGSYLHYV
jgi:hypothetical protein